MNRSCKADRKQEVRAAPRAYRRSFRVGAAWRARPRGGGARAGRVTVRLPREVAQWAQRNSWSSPLGKTNKSRSRTGCDVLHLGQYSSLAVNSPNCCAIRLILDRKSVV